jgi:exopolysaccharide biosynthesis predicted pyruvyltransferase EpsI
MWKNILRGYSELIVLFKRYEDYYKKIRRIFFCRYTNSKGYKKIKVLSIPVYNKKIKEELTAQNFNPVKNNNENLLRGLRALDTFTYIPNNGNMGDILIAKATFDFFENNKIKYRPFKGRPADNIVYGGGGIWNEYYKNSWIKFLPFFCNAKKVVILPSSFYNCPELTKILDERFTVFCREKQSYDYLTAAKTNAKIILDHDMVFYMSEKALLGTINIYDKKALLKLSGDLNKVPLAAKFMRSDIEKNNDCESDMDLSSYLSNDEFITPKEADFGAKVMLSVVDGVNAVITDRLHIAIAGALLGKQVYMLDNSYKKLSEVYKHSLSVLPNVHFCDKIPQNISAPHTATDNFQRILRACK